MTNPDHAASARRVVLRVLGIAKLFMVPALLLMANHAFAAGGMDTSSETWNNFHTWLNTWIPLAATVIIVVCAIGWWINMIPAGWAFKGIVAMMAAGSAAYLVSLTGLGT